MKSYFIQSTIGRKVFVGLTGIFLSLFIFMHMMGGLLIFAGDKTYNLYSHALINNPFIVFFELVLLSAFGIHILWALALVWSNRQKKGGEAQKPDPDLSLVHKTLWIQGGIILLFVILHLITFKYGPYYSISYGGEAAVRDLYRLVNEVFQSPLYVFWYLFCLLILSFHIGHGLKASLQTLGFYAEPFLSRLSLLFAVLVGGGFIIQPLYFFIGGFFGR